jgi:uncharacterized repeat protein (TIGR01451 family)
MSVLRSFRRGRRGRRLWVVGAALVAAASFGGVFVASSGAVPSPCPIPGHFEIDGDMTQQTCNPGADDWNTPNIGVQSTTQGGTYSTSGKDGGDPSTWSSSGSTPDKTNFAQAYATSRVVGGDFYVFVAWERTDTSGTQGYAIEISNSGANLGADGVTPQPNRGSGGSVFYISSQGSSAPLFNSACSYTTQSDYGTTCTSSSQLAGVTMAINTASISDPLNNTTQPAGAFFEVALDISTLTGIHPSCPGPSAASVYLRSITGQTKNGNLKGYMAPLSVAPDSTCVPPPISTTANPGGSTAALGSTQHDDVTVSDGTNVGIGSVKFFLCSPADVANNQNGDCAQGGTQVGSVKTLNGSGQASSDSIDGTTTPNDNTPGKYCWRAEFTPNANDHHFLPGSHTNNGTECFTIVKNQPSLTTKLSKDSILNTDPVTDTATLAGATDDASGTITISVYSGSDASACDGTAVASETASPATDGNGDYTATFDNLAAGSYEFQASIAADAKNKSAVSECGTEPLTVMNQPSLTTKLSKDSILNTDSVTDTATLAGATDDASGTITIGVYSGNDATACDGNPVDSKTATPATSGNGDYSATFSGLAAGRYEFQASIAADAKNLSAVSECGTEPLTVQNQPAITTTQDPALGSVGDTFKDKATLSGGASPVGTITFDLYDNNSCSGEPVYEETVSVDGNGTYETANGVQLNSAGTYYWVATYGGDDNNKSAMSGCGEEPVAVKGAAIHILKTADKAQVNAGDPIGFTLTVWNDGDGAAHGVKLSDPLPVKPGLVWTIDAQGAGWNNTCVIASGTLTCGGADGVTVPAGTTQTASTFTVHITSPTTGATGGDCPETGVVDNTGSVTTSNDGKGDSTASTCVQAVIDLAITKTGSPATQPLNTSSQITWTMVVTNHGPSAATGVTVSDPMPAGNTYVSSTTTQGTCTGGATLNCDIGDMAVGATVTITLVTTPSTPGTQTNTAVVMGDQPESNLANNTATASVEVTQVFPPPACVRITKITPGQLIVGRKTVVTIHMARQGGSAKGTKVRIKGAGINVKTKGANSKGVIKKTLKMKKKGILVFTPLVTKTQGGACGAQRIGVRGVFTPPVTG